MHEFDLCLKYKCEYTHRHGYIQYWTPTLIRTDAYQENDVMIIPNVEAYGVFHRAHLFFIIRGTNPYSIHHAGEMDFQIMYRSNEIPDTETNEKIIQIFDKKQPDFTLYSPGLSTVNACKRWYRKYRENHVEYTVLMVEVNDP